jgi:UDP-glucose:(heptosyl)LPS alpha-1,3-glucosyltransferase
MKNGPEIAIVRQKYNPFGGAERFVERALEALRNKGVNTTIITRSWANDQGALICNPPYAGSLWRDWGFARSVCKVLKKQPFDIVQSHERLTCCTVYRAGDGVHREWLAQRSRILGRADRIRIALNPYHAYVNTTEEQMYRGERLKAVICNSRMVSQEIQRHFSYPADRIHVIYSGVDSQVFHPGLRQEHANAVRTTLQIPEKSGVVLFVGSGFQRKGLAALIQALALTQNLSLIVVGKDRKQGEFEALGKRMGISDRLHFVGGQKDVRPYYGAADIFALPTLYDPFPNVALEAFACGLPVITSHKSGAAEMVTANNGAVLDALDIQGLAASLEKFREYAPATCEAARATIEHLSLENMAAQLVSLYEILLREAA